MQTDIQVIENCLQGDQSAYKALYERYAAYCYGICKRYGIKDADIKDQIQVTFTEAFKSLPRYESEKAGFKTWLSRICIHHILSKKRKYKEKVFIDDISLHENELESFHFQEEYNTIDKEYLLRLLNKMPDKFREVFNLYIIDGYSHKEIAQRLDISESSSRVILNRGRTWAKEAVTKFLNT